MKLINVTEFLITIYSTPSYVELTITYLLFIKFPVIHFVSSLSSPCEVVLELHHTGFFNQVRRVCV